MRFLPPPSPSAEAAARALLRCLFVKLSLEVVSPIWSGAWDVDGHVSSDQAWRGLDGKLRSSNELISHSSLWQMLGTEGRNTMP